MRKVFNASAVLVVVGAAIVVAGLLLLDLLSGNGVFALICISMGLLLQLVVLAYLTGAGISTLVRRLIAARGGERDSSHATAQPGHLPSDRMAETISRAT